MTAQQHKNNSDTTVLSLSKQMPVLTKHQPEHNDRRNETSDNQSVIYSLKDATTTWEKRSKDCLPDIIVFLTWFGYKSQLQVISGYLL